MYIAISHTLHCSPCIIKAAARVIAIAVQNSVIGTGNLLTKTYLYVGS